MQVHPTLTRIAAIDVLRGLVMVVMALDHTRDYFHADALVYDPTDLSKSNPALFLTRWITHFCAPAFLFLAGLSAYLRRATFTRTELSRYLLKRGLWLMLLDVVVLRFILVFNYYPQDNMLSILWLIGCCMVLLSGLIYLQHWAIALVALVIIFGHNITDGMMPSPGSFAHTLWVLFWNGGTVQLSPTVVVFSTYAVIPWLGIMMLGYFTGRWYGTPYTDKMRRRLLVNVGLLAINLFLFFRYTGFYGDPRPAEDYAGGLTTMLSFLNVTKYPVSLQFTLMTIGPLMIMLAVLEKTDLRRFKAISVFGRVPLFYFLAHFLLIHIAALSLYMIQTGKGISEIDFHFPASLGGVGADGGTSLPWVYLAWVLVVSVMYPLCVWYDKFRRTGLARWTRFF